MNSSDGVVDVAVRFEAGCLAGIDGRSIDFAVRAHKRTVAWTFALWFCLA